VVSGTISLPSQGFFSPFPHGTGSLSVASEYLALPDGPGRFKQGFSCPALLRYHLKEDCIFTYAAVTLFGRPFQTVRLTLFYPSFHQLTAPSLEHPVNDCGPATPGSPFESPGLGSSDFARHYFRNHGCFLFLRVLRWFTSPGSLQHPMDSGEGNQSSSGWVPPFGHPRITDCLHLPEAFRSWPRPSSPTCAKASTRMLLVA
jgi:hypothetical protein